jgi:hypothetical protein
MKKIFKKILKSSESFFIIVFLFIIFITKNSSYLDNYLSMFFSLDSDLVIFWNFIISIWLIYIITQINNLQPNNYRNKFPKLIIPLILILFCNKLYDSNEISKLITKNIEDIKTISALAVLSILVIAFLLTLLSPIVQAFSEAVKELHEENKVNKTKSRVPFPESTKNFFKTIFNVQFSKVGTIVLVLANAVAICFYSYFLHNKFDMGIAKALFIAGFVSISVSIFLIAAINLIENYIKNLVPKKENGLSNSKAIPVIATITLAILLIVILLSFLGMKGGNKLAIFISIIPIVIIIVINLINRNEKLDFIGITALVILIVLIVLGYKNIKDFLDTFLSKFSMSFEDLMNRDIVEKVVIGLISITLLIVLLIYLIQLLRKVGGILFFKERPVKTNIDKTIDSILDSIADLIGMTFLAIIKVLEILPNFFALLYGLSIDSSKKKNNQSSNLPTNNTNNTNNPNPNNNSNSTPLPPQDTQENKED